MTSTSTSSDAVLLGVGCMSYIDSSVGSLSFSSFLVLLSLLSGFFILAFGVSGKGGKCCQVSLILMNGKPVVACFGVFF